MKRRSRKDAKGACGQSLFLVLLFIVIVIIIVFQKVAVLGSFAFFLFFFVVVIIVGNDVQMHGMYLRDLQFGLALGTAQDLAFFDFVFVDVDFGRTFRATNHGLHPSVNL